MAQCKRMVPLFVVLPTTRVEVNIAELRERVERIRLNSHVEGHRKAAQHRAQETLDAIDTWVKRLPKKTRVPASVLDAYEAALEVVAYDPRLGVAHA